MQKIKVLKQVGPFAPGQEVEVDDEMAKQLCDGVKAMPMADFEKLDAARKDPKNLTVMEMHQLGIKNIASPNPDHEVYVKTESAALAGKPFASGEPVTTTGGVTPPTLVFPAMAKAGQHEVSDAKDLKKDNKKVEEKAPEKKK